MLRKTKGVELVHSKALDSEGFQRILNLESSWRESTDNTLNIDVAETELLRAGVGLHPEEESWASDDVTGGVSTPSWCGQRGRRR